MRIELLPESVIDARCRARLLAAWGRAVAVAAVVAGASILAAPLLMGPDAAVGPRTAVAADATSPAELEKERQRLVAAEAAASETLRQTMVRLSANRALADSVDWSDLLRAVAEAAGEQVVLSRVALGETAGAVVRGGNAPRGPIPTVADPPGLAVLLEGFGRTPQDVARFVIALEGSDIFDRVALVQTRGTTVRGGTVSSYQVRCIVRDRATEAGP